MPIPCEFTISKNFIYRCQRLAIRIASSILVREVVVHERPHLSGRHQRSPRTDDKPRTSFCMGFITSSIGIAITG